MRKQQIGQCDVKMRFTTDIYKLNVKNISLQYVQSLINFGLIIKPCKNQLYQRNAT